MFYVPEPLIKYTDEEINTEIRTLHEWLKHQKELGHNLDREMLVRYLDVMIQLRFERDCARVREYKGPK